jgi:hypothetical protein
VREIVKRETIETSIARGRQGIPRDAATGAGESARVLGAGEGRREGSAGCGLCVKTGGGTVRGTGRGLWACLCMRREPTKWS